MPACAAGDQRVTGDRLRPWTEQEFKSAGSEGLGQPEGARSPSQGLGSGSPARHTPAVTRSLPTGTGSGSGTGGEDATAPARMRLAARLPAECPEGAPGSCVKCSGGFSLQAQRIPVPQKESVAST